MATKLGLAPHEGAAKFAWAITANRYRFRGGILEGKSGSALRGTPHQPCLDWLVPGSDAFCRPSVDVGVVGSAWAPRRPCSRSTAALVVGASRLEVAVSGRRFVEWGPLRFSEAESFEKVELTNRNAYGGVDGRLLPYTRATSIEELFRAVGSHPGAYPRNPAGKGYLVADGPLEGVELPGLEDPGDLLTPERLVVGDAARWWQQPVPRSLAFRDLAMFPRLLALGAKPPHAPPDDARLAEVRIGELESGFGAGTVPLATTLREAPYGMSFASLESGTPVVCEGMAPEGAIVAMQVPDPPSFEFVVDGVVERVVGRASTVEVYPELEELRVTHYGRTAELARKFIPGVHRSIPVRVAVDGLRIDYQAPPTMHDLFVSGGIR